MSVVAIQAEAAPYRVENPPPELEQAFATIRENAVAAIWPAAPPRFSTVNGCPRLAWSRSLNTRARMSVAPPAANGTITFTGAEG